MSSPSPSVPLPALHPEVTELGTPGTLRDRLVAAVVAGEKTATTCLEVLYRLAGEEPPAPGTRSALLDSDGGVVGTVEYTRVYTLPLGLIGWEVARDEGEGFASVAEWRAAHEQFWARFVPAVRVRLGDPGWRLTDEEPVVVEYFRLLRRSDGR